jgi:predicted RNase H-like HicB family nuclease
MRTTTLKFVVSGDSYEELSQAADAAISKFLGAHGDEEDDEEFEPEPPSHSINYELIVSEITEITSEYQYTAEVIARIKDVRQQ